MNGEAEGDGRRNEIRDRKGCGIGGGREGGKSRRDKRWVKEI